MTPLRDESTKDITRILDLIGKGHESAANDLFRVVYSELKRMAHWHLSKERKGQTFQPTELVNEAYLRLIGGDAKLAFNSRKVFFVAAAEAMRRILVDAARRRRTQKRGGEFIRVNLEDVYLSTHRPDELLNVHEALDRLHLHDADCADLVRLHYFGGHNLSEAAVLLNISRATANRWWVYAKVWLKTELSGE